MKKNLEKQVSFRVGNEEYHRLQQEAQASNMTISKYTRSMVLKEHPEIIDRSKEILHHVAEISTYCNAEMVRHSLDNIEVILKECADLWQFLKS